MLDRLETWSNTWQMPFNVSKCHIMNFHKNNPNYKFILCSANLEAVDIEKDLGVLIETSLKPAAKVQRVASKVRRALGQLTRGLTYRDKTSFVLLYKSFVLPIIQCAMPAWRPWTEGDINRLKDVQRKFVARHTRRG